MSSAICRKALTTSDLASSLSPEHTAVILFISTLRRNVCLKIRNLISSYLIADSADIIASDSPFKTNPEGLNAVFAALKPEPASL